MQQCWEQYQQISQTLENDDVGEKVRQLLHSLIQSSQDDLHRAIAEKISPEELADQTVNRVICERLAELGIDYENLIQTQPHTYQMF